MIDSIYQVIWHRRRSKKNKQELLNKLGGKCVNCGESDYDVLQFDHIEDNGRLDRVKRGVINSGREFYKKMLLLSNVKEILQILCANCNWKKRSIKEELEFLEKIGIPPF